MEVPQGCVEFGGKNVEKDLNTELARATVIIALSSLHDTIAFHLTSNHRS
jgi:hypothetical protein